jgi:tRNA (guanine-N7-)-methyltransferase
MSDTKPMRTIRSFVKREGRLTPGQQRAIDQNWADFAVDDGENIIDLDSLFGRTAPKVIDIGLVMVHH